MHVQIYLAIACISALLRCSVLAAPSGATARLPIEPWAARNGLSLTGKGGGTLRFAHPLHTVVFQEGRRRLLVDRMTVYLNAPLLADNGQWTLTRVDADSILAPLLRPPSLSGLPAAATVMLDPGHGGDDSGARGRDGAAEKAIVLDIARLVRKKLAGTGLDVRLTRTRDHVLTLKERIAITQDSRADLFVSIHANSSGNSRADGVETYAMPAAGFPSTAQENGNSPAYRGNRHDKANSRLAYAIHRGVLNQTLANDRGIRRARFEVLREAPCPAVLIECGFLSHPAENRRLAAQAYREKVAEGIARGILTYTSRLSDRQP